MVYCYWLIVAQIVLESFPISSSSHTLLLERLLKQNGYIISCTNGLSSFFGAISFTDLDLVSHLVHGPTLIIVALFFFNRWFFLLRHPIVCWRIIAKLIFFAGVSDLITALFFMLFRAIGTDWFPLGVGFAITAAGFFSLRALPMRASAQLTTDRAIILGLAQSIGLLPGISRLGITYVAGRWLGFDARKSFEVSLMIQWPLILIACAHSIHTLVAKGLIAQYLNPELLLIMMGASVIAFYGLWFTYYCFITSRERWFAWYLLFPTIIWVWTMKG